MCTCQPGLYAAEALWEKQSVTGPLGISEHHLIDCFLERAVGLLCLKLISQREAVKYLGQ